ncbi:MAG: hypothetical protein R2940_02705 [Syntrophotaleaceae bacterium]
MIRILGAVLIIGSGLLVLYAEGCNWIALWNLMPLALAALAIMHGPGAERPSWSAVIFAGVTALAITLTHAAWVFDWSGIRTGSSTAGLLLLFSPIYSVLLGTVGWAGAKWLSSIF